MTLVTMLLTLMLCSFVAVPSAWAVLYAADGAGGNLANLYTLDPATGAVISTIGPIGFAVTGLAVHPVTGVMYGSVGNASPVSPRSLITVDKLTGQGTLVGSFGVPGHTMADLAFTSDGTLYGWAEPHRDTLHRIDLATGQATQVGESGIGTSGSGLAATTQAFLLAGDGANDFLYSIDRLTGRSTVVRFFGAPPGGGALVPLGRPTLSGPDIDVPALTFGPGGVLYGAGDPQGNSRLITINVITGEVTVVGPTVGNIDALVFDPPVFPEISPPVPVPTMSQAAFAIMAVLLVAVAVHQMRRRQPPASG